MMPFALLGPGDGEPPDRVSEDDMPAHLEALFLAQALRRVPATPVGEPGRCGNCGQACMPNAVYCDADCRDDHELRLRAGGRR